jgi:hypothetical protein
MNIPRNNGLIIGYNLEIKIKASQGKPGTDYYDLNKHINNELNNERIK